MADSRYNCRLGDRCTLKWSVVVNMLLLLFNYTVLTLIGV